MQVQGRGAGAVRARARARAGARPWHSRFATENDDARQRPSRARGETEKGPETAVVLTLAQIGDGEEAG